MSDEVLTNPTGLQRTILDNPNVAVLMQDANLCIQYLNPAAESLFHLSSKRALGLCIDKMLFVDPHLFGRLRDSLLHSHPYAEHELTVDVAPGQKITIDYRATPLQQADQPSMLLLEITHIDRQLRIAREEKLLSEQVASRQLVRGMAHEIKNPLVEHVEWVLQSRWNSKGLTILTGGVPIGRSCEMALDSSPSHGEFINCLCQETRHPGRSPVFSQLVPVRSPGRRPEVSMTTRAFVRALSSPIRARLIGDNRLLLMTGNDFRREGSRADRNARSRADVTKVA